MPPITVEDFIAAFSDAAVETEGVALDKKKIALELHAVITDIEDALGKSDLPAKHPARETVQKQVDRLKAINLDDPDDLSKVKDVVKKTKADSTKIKALLKNDHFIRRDKKAHDYLERFKEMTSQLNARGLLRDGTNEDLAKFRPAEGAYGAWKRKLDSLESGEVSKLNEGFFNSEIGKLKDEIRAVIQKGQTAIEESQKNAKKQLEDRAKHRAKLIKLTKPLADAIEILQNNFACLLAAWNVVAKTDDTFPLRDNRRSFIDKLNEMRSAAEFPSPEAVAEEVRRCEDEVRDMQTEVETMGRLATTELEVTAMTMPDPHRRGDEWRAPLDELRRHFDDLINDTKAKRELESERSYKELKEILSSSAVPALSDFLKCAKNIDILERKLKEKKKVTFGNGKSVEIDPREIVGIDGVDDTRKQQVIEKLSQKVIDGQKLVQRILAVTGEIDDALQSPDGALKDIPPTKANLASILWFVKMVAEGKAGTTFERGAMTVPDPKGNLRHYMDLCSENYLRGSSHLEEEQKKEDGTARGIDYYGGNIQNDADLDEMLPMGANTGLTQTVYGKGEAGDRMLYVKFETEGARRSTHRSNLDVARLLPVLPLPLPLLPLLLILPADRGTRDKVVIRQTQDGDFRRAATHGLNYLRESKTLYKGLPQFREKMTEECKSAYEDLVESAKKAKINPLPKKSVKSYAEMFAAIEALPDKISPEMQGHLSTLVVSLEKSIPNFAGEISTKNQFGDEVQVTAADFGFGDIAH